MTQHPSLASVRGALLGLAIGDAVGTTVEFEPRGTFPPLTDLVGGGPFGLRAGEWTDDTSMALCLATSLVERGGFDARDQMERYLRWLRDGYLSSTGRCFDIGNTVDAALHRFATTGEPMSGSTDPRSAGNGSLMRLAPVVLFYARDPVAAVANAIESSRTTHGALECLESCALFAELLLRALAGSKKVDVLAPSPRSFQSERLEAIARGAFLKKSIGEIRGTSYVVDCLEAALWCFSTTDSFREAILAAANLGHDADTTAAVTGQIAGAFYGEDGIPPEWLARLAMRDEIAALADRLAEGPRA